VGLDDLALNVRGPSRLLFVDAGRVLLAVRPKSPLDNQS
jgi:hypothetical protein